MYATNDTDRMDMHSDLSQPPLATMQGPQEFARSVTYGSHQILQTAADNRL